jgi:hypothetical protein
MRRIVLLIAAAFIAVMPATVQSETVPGIQNQSGTKKPAVKKAAPLAANQYSSEAEAKQRCGADTVVWLNLSSKIYHSAGTRDYGKTRRGAYMCRTDADRAGNRAVKGSKAKDKK